jgi:hypothetical protein
VVTYCVTFDEVDPSNEEVDDFSDHGFVLPGGRDWSVLDEPVGEAFAARCREMGVDYTLDPINDPKEGEDPIVDAAVSVLLHRYATNYSGYPFYTGGGVVYRVGAELPDRCVSHGERAL